MQRLYWKITKISVPRTQNSVTLVAICPRDDWEFNGNIDINDNDINDKDDDKD